MSSALDIKESENVVETYDAFEQLHTKIIGGLLDGKACVELVEVSPRICPVGYTPEYLCVRGARVSFGYGLKTPELDNNLLKYLLRNRHTSPIELPNVTFRLTIPTAIAIHFLRHRTGKFNQLSQRYAEIGKQGDDTWFHPLKWDQGIRIQSKINKQGSSTDEQNEEDANRIMHIMRLYSEAENHIEKIHSLYHQMINLGLANEIARMVLPMSEYTILYCQWDMNNLSKLLHLRADYEHAQKETAVIATAMLDLVKPLFPTIIDHLEGQLNGLTLSQEEILILKQQKIPPHVKGSFRTELIEKARKLGVNVE